MGALAGGIVGRILRKLGRFTDNLVLVGVIMVGVTARSKSSYLLFFGILLGGAGIFIGGVFILLAGITTNWGHG
jgi:hypothetical protein